MQTHLDNINEQYLMLLRININLNLSIWEN